MRRCALILVVLLAGCGKKEVGKEPRPAPAALRFAEGTPLDEDGAARLDFGEVAAGKQVRTILLLENRSDEPLPLEIEGPSAPFALLDAPEVLAPRSRGSLIVRFAPTREEASGEMTIRAGKERLRVHLVGKVGDAPVVCDLALDPPALRLTVAEDDPGVPWEIPIELVVERGRCLVDEVRVEGEFAVEVEGVEGLLFLEGTKATASIRLAGGRAGVGGAIVFRVADREVELPLEIAARPSCMQADHPALDLVSPLYCDESGSITFVGCPDPPELVASRIWPEAEESFFQVEAPHPGVGSIQYVANDPLHHSQAVAIFDFRNGDRVYVDLAGTPQMEEERFVIPERELDLLVLVDKTQSLESRAEKLVELADALWFFVRESSWSVSVAITTTAWNEDEDCPPERGRLLPLDGSRPKIVTRETPDGREVLLQNLQPDSCPNDDSSTGASLGLTALRTALHETSDAWRRPGATTMALFVVGEEESSPGPVWPDHVSLLRHAGLDRLDVVGPCVFVIRYWTASDRFQGQYRELCESDPFTPIFEELDEDFPYLHVFALEGEADTSGEDFASEESSIFVFVGEERLPSGGEPDWVVVEDGRILRMEWGLEPGTEIRIRYPLSVCEKPPP